MTKKNIAIIYLGNFFYDARCINMALSLKRENYRVSIIHIGTIKDIIPLEFNSIHFHNIEIINIKLIKYFSFYFQVKKILQKNTFHQLIAGDLYSLANICHYRHTAHLIYDCREIYCQLSAHYTQPLKRYASLQYEKFLLQYIDTVFVTAHTDLIFLKKKYQQYKHLHWYTIFNFPSNYIKTKNINLRLKYKIPSDHRLIIYQGVIQKNRGILKLIKVIQHTKNYTALIVGDGPALPLLKCYAKKNKLNLKIHFIGKLSYFKMFSYTANCNIGWLMIRDKGLSNQFALPNKLFEYTLMGLQVVSSALPNIQPIIDNNNFGVCIKDFETKAIIQGLQSLDKNTTSRSEISQKTISKYTWNTQHNIFIQAVENYDF